MDGGPTECVDTELVIGSSLTVTVGTVRPSNQHLGWSRFAPFIKDTKPQAGMDGRVRNAFDLDKETAVSLPFKCVRTALKDIPRRKIKQVNE